MIINFCILPLTEIPSWEESTKFILHQHKATGRHGLTMVDNSEFPLTVVNSSIWISSPDRERRSPLPLVLCHVYVYVYLIMSPRLGNVDIIWILVSPPCPTEFHARLNWKSAEFTAVEADTAEFWATYQKLVCYKFRPHFKYSAQTGTCASHHSKTRPETTNLN